MNRLVIFEREYSEYLPTLQAITLSDRLRVDHVRNILKLSVGDDIKIVLENKGLATGRVSYLSESSLTLNIVEQFCGNVANIHLIVGLSRPQTCKKVIEHGTSMGVSSFDFFTGALSEKSYANAKLFSEKEYEELLHLGISQSNGLYKIPELRVHKHINREFFQSKNQKYILSPFTENTFLDESLDFDRPITLALGSERGFTSKEVEIFKELGYKEIKISPSILRVEIATFAALGQLDLLAMKSKKDVI